MCPLQLLLLLIARAMPVVVPRRVSVLKGGKPTTTTSHWKFGRSHWSSLCPLWHHACCSTAMRWVTGWGDGSRWWWWGGGGEEQLFVSCYTYIFFRSIFPLLIIWLLSCCYYYYYPWPLTTTATIHYNQEPIRRALRKKKETKNLPAATPEK